MNREAASRRTPRLQDDVLTAARTLADEDDLEDAIIAGDFVGSELSHFRLRSCRVNGAAFTGCRLVRGAFVDCVIVASDFSGAVFTDCRFDRVEFRRCRLSGVQAQESSLSDVALLDCKVDGGNFRMTVWDRA